MRRPHLLLLLLSAAVEAKEFRTITIAKSRRKYEKESSQRLQYNKGGDYKFERFQTPSAIRKSFEPVRSEKAFKPFTGKDGRKGYVASTRLGGDWVLAESAQIAPSCTAEQVLKAYLNPALQAKWSADKVQDVKVQRKDKKNGGYGAGQPYYQQDLILHSQRVIASNTGVMRYSQAVTIDKIGTGNYACYVEMDPDQPRTEKCPFEALAVYVGLTQKGKDVHIYAAGIMEVNRKVVPNLVVFDASGIAGDMAGKGTLWLSGHFEEMKAAASRRGWPDVSELKDKLKKLRGGSMVSTLPRSTFNYNSFECSFRRKAAASGFESQPPLLLIHPVGIGLASWFWDQFLDEWNGGEVYVPDLIGCGDSQEWDPSEQGLFVPLDWVRQLETLWVAEIRRPMVVMSQGGLAPLAIQLASRMTDNWDGQRAVCGLVLASPPEWTAISTGIDEAEVRRNYNQLATFLGPSPLGTLAFNALCARFFVKFFSDLFLFAEGGADDKFLDACCVEAVPEKRYPIIAFNAGLVLQRGLYAELTALQQPALVLAGESGGKPKTDEYATFVPKARVERIAGKNVLPWEEPKPTCDAVARFVAACPSEEQRVNA